MKFAAYMAVWLITSFYMLLVLVFCIIIYMDVQPPVQWVQGLSRG